MNEKSESDNHSIQEKADWALYHGDSNHSQMPRAESENCQNTIAIYQNDNVEKRYLDSLSMAQSKGKTVEQLEILVRTCQLRKVINLWNFERK